MSTKSTKSARTTNDSATREETTAITAIVNEASDTFVAAARTRSGSFLAEAAAYVAAVEAFGGRRGADAEVQRTIGAAVRDAGYEPYSSARYSKLAGAYRAMPQAGLRTGDADDFTAIYELWNLSTTKVSAAERGEVVKSARRRKSPDAARAFIIKAVADLKSRKPEPSEGDETGDDVESTTDLAPTVDAPATVGDVEYILDAIAELYGMTDALADADRIRVADAFRASADALLTSVVPADTSTLAAA